MIHGTKAGIYFEKHMRPEDNDYVVSIANGCRQLYCFKLVIECKDMLFSQDSYRNEEADSDKPLLSFINGRIEEEQLLEGMNDGMRFIVRNLGIA